MSSCMIYAFVGHVNSHLTGRLDGELGWSNDKGYRVLDEGLGGEGRLQLLETKHQNRTKGLIMVNRSSICFINNIYSVFIFKV